MQYDKGAWGMTKGSYSDPTVFKYEALPTNLKCVDGEVHLGSSFGVFNYCAFQSI